MRFLVGLKRARIMARQMDGRGDRITNLLIFRVYEYRLGLPIELVSKVVPMVEITPLPGAPAVVLGLVDIAGRLVPVFDVGQRLRQVRLSCRGSDRLLIADIGGGPLALAVNDVIGVEEVAASLVQASVALPANLDHIKGITTTPDGIVLIQDLDRFLSVAEEEQLQQAMMRQRFADGHAADTAKNNGAGAPSVG